MTQRYLGIDIGSCNIKIASVEVKKNSIVLRSPIVIKTPKFFVQNGRITDIDEFFVLLKEAVPKRLIKLKKVIVVLNDSLVVTRDVEMPDVKTKEMTQMVKLDASEYLPFDVDEYTIRYRTLIPAKHNPKKVNYILMAAVKSELVMDFYEVFRKLGLKPAAIDVTLNSMIKYFQRTLKSVRGKPQTEESIAILDLGASSVKMVIMHAGIPVYQQVLNHSSQKIDVLIANTLNVERVEAEELKIKHGLEYLSGNTEDEVARTVGSIIITQIDLLLNDLYRQLELFASRSGYGPVARISLMGGMSSLKSLSRYIQEAFSIPCEVVETNNAVGFSLFDILDHAADKDLQNPFSMFANIAGAAYRSE